MQERICNNLKPESMATDQGNSASDRCPCMKLIKMTQHSPTSKKHNLQHILFKNYSLQASVGV